MANDRQPQEPNDYRSSERDTIISIHPVFFIIPLLAPLLTPVLVGAIALITTLITIAAVLAGLGGGASAGSIIGGIIGGAIAFAIGTAISTAVYYALPPLLLFLAIVLYLGVSIAEEIRGDRLKAEIGEFKLNLRFFSFVSVAITGIMSFIIFSAFAAMGFFLEEHRQSERGMNLAFDSFARRVGNEFDVIFGYISAGEVISIIALIVSVAWACWVYVGLNYQISRSIKYCIDIYLTAFVMDTVVTILGFIVVGPRFEYSIFISFFNTFDGWLRTIAMAPVRLVFSIFSDLRPMFDAVEQLMSTLSNFAFTLVEISVRTVFFADSSFRDLVFGFIDFAHFLKVDFLFFLLSSLLYYRLRRSRWKSD